MMLIQENNYYVYMHRRKDTDVVFYIGKGRNNRAYQNSCRSPAWFATAENAGGFIVDFYKESLSEKDALLIESELIANPSEEWSLVNKKIKTDFAIPEIESLKQYLKYDPSSPSGLIWLKKPGPRIMVGTHAGCLARNGVSDKKEWQVRFKSKLYKAHRLIMYLLYGEFDPNLVINHIDCNPSNNLSSNLEFCTKAENANRQTCHIGGTKKNNTSGMNGLFTTIRKNSKYSVIDITINGTRYCKYFSHMKHGEVSATLLAKEYLSTIKQKEYT